MEHAATDMKNPMITELGTSKASGMESPPSEMQHVENQDRQPAIPTDLDDPHRAALEENPEHAEKLTWVTTLAVIVSALAS